MTKLTYFNSFRTQESIWQVTIDDYDLYQTLSLSSIPPLPPGAKLSDRVFYLAEMLLCIEQEREKADMTNEERLQEEIFGSMPREDDDLIESEEEEELEDENEPDDLPGADEDDEEIEEEEEDTNDDDEWDDDED